MPKYLIFFQKIQIWYLFSVEICEIIHRIQCVHVPSVRWIIPIFHHKNITDPDLVKISQKKWCCGFFISRNIEIQALLGKNNSKNSSCSIISDLHTPAADHFFSIMKNSLFCVCLGFVSIIPKLLIFQSPPNTKIAPVVTLQKYLYMLLLMPSYIEKCQNISYFFNKSRFGIFSVLKYVK